MPTKQIKSKERVIQFGEVFTNEREVNAMLDMVASECERIESRFLEPACGDGNFLAEVLSRKLAVVKKNYGKSEPDYERNALLAVSSLYGVEILADNAVACRKRLFQQFSAEYKATVSDSNSHPFLEIVRAVISWNIRVGNFLTMNLVDKEQNDTNEPIVFSEWLFTESGELNRRDYWARELLEDSYRQVSLFEVSDSSCFEGGHNEESYNYGSLAIAGVNNCRSNISSLTFDVVIGNPPYQLSDGGNKASASPLYHKFVEQAEKLNPRYLAMIIPARWFAGGKGLDSFRKKMLGDKHITHLVDYPDSKDCFPGVDIAGGVCYFLRERDTLSRTCEVTTIKGDKSSCSLRVLDEYPTFIRNANAVSILHKVESFAEEPLSKQVSSRKPFGLATNVKPEKTGDLTLRYLGGEGPYPRKAITAGIDIIDKWKVVASYVSFDHAGRENKHGMRKVISRMSILPPGTICTETYLVYGAYSSKEEAINLRCYLSCKLPRFLIAQMSTGQHLTKGTFALCPIPDTTVAWTDELLYKKYGLTKAEQAIIEDSIIEIPHVGQSDE